jgi:hypothetical protein
MATKAMRHGGILRTQAQTTVQAPAVQPQKLTRELIMNLLGVDEQELQMVMRLVQLKSAEAELRIAEAAVAATVPALNVLLSADQVSRKDADIADEKAFDRRRAARLKVIEAGKDNWYTPSTPVIANLGKK